MLRRTFLKAFSALAAVPLLPPFMRRQVKRVTLTYEGESVQLDEICKQAHTFNDRPLSGADAGGLFCIHHEFEVLYRHCEPYYHATVIYERRPERSVYLNSWGDVIGPFMVFKRSDPILRSMRLIGQEVEYA